MTPPATEHAVPMAVMVLGWTPRLTSQFATGSITRRYPFFSQSGRIFIRFRHAGWRAGQQATRRAGSRLNRCRVKTRREWRKATPGAQNARAEARIVLRFGSKKYPLHRVVATDREYGV